MMNCISCGKDIADNSKFCRFCSAPQVAKPSVPSCNKCGTALLPNAKFCKGCGEKIEQANSTPIDNSPLQTQQPIKSVAHSSTPTAPQVVSNPNISTGAIYNKKTGITGLQIAIGFAAIILLAALVFFIKSKNDITEPAVAIATPPLAEAPQQVEATITPIAPAVPQEATVTCSDVKYGNESYHQKMEELAVLAELPDGYYSRYDEDVVSNICKGNMEDINASIDYGYVKSSAVKAILKVLIGHQPEAEKIYSKVLTEENRSAEGKKYEYLLGQLMGMGAGTSAASNMAMYYIEKPESQCAMLVQRALDGELIKSPLNGDASLMVVDEIYDSPEYCLPTPINVSIAEELNLKSVDIKLIGILDNSPNVAEFLTSYSQAAKKKIDVATKKVGKYEVVDLIKYAKADDNKKLLITAPLLGPGFDSFIKYYELDGYKATVIVEETIAQGQNATFSIKNNKVLYTIDGTTELVENGK